MVSIEPVSGKERERKKKKKKKKKRKEGKKKNENDSIGLLTHARENELKPHGVTPRNKLLFQPHPPPLSPRAGRTFTETIVFTAKRCFPQEGKDLKIKLLGLSLPGDLKLH